jgi:hypothetical protein
MSPINQGSPEIVQRNLTHLYAPVSPLRPEVVGDTSGADWPTNLVRAGRNCACILGCRDGCHVCITLHSCMRASCVSFPLVLSHARQT